MTVTHPFHLAFPVADLEATRDFYVRLLGCRIGREDPGRWIDFDFYGHQISAHWKPEEVRLAQTNRVDGDPVPTRHFGLVLDGTTWEALAQKLENAHVPFLIEPKTRFRGEAGEQSSFFVSDPSGNALEFKSFRDRRQLFAT